MRKSDGVSTYSNGPSVDQRVILFPKGGDIFTYAAVKAEDIETHAWDILLGNRHILLLVCYLK